MSNDGESRSAPGSASFAGIAPFKPSLIYLARVIHNDLFLLVAHLTTFEGIPNACGEAALLDCPGSARIFGKTRKCHRRQGQACSYRTTPAGSPSAERSNGRAACRERSWCCGGVDLRPSAVGIEQELSLLRLHEALHRQWRHPNCPTYWPARTRLDSLDMSNGSCAV